MAESVFDRRTIKDKASTYVEALYRTLSSSIATETAEEVGFEPTEPETGSPVFETGPFDHSGTPP